MIYKDKSDKKPDCSVRNPTAAARVDIPPHDMHSIVNNYCLNSLKSQ